MKTSLRILLTGSILALAGVVACLDTAPRTITSDESKIQINHVPGLEGRPIAYRYYGWRPSYQAVEQYYAAGPPTTEEYSAEVRASSKAVPRLEVHFYVVAPGWEWNRELAVNEDYVKGYSFFRDKPVTISLSRLAVSPAVTVVPFQAADANCFAFVADNVALPHRADQNTQPVAADGYYCAAPGAPLDAAVTTAVLSNILVTDSPLHPRVPILPLAAAQVPGH